jgi:tetratricopeptide (TPR) repeat protein
VLALVALGCATPQTEAVLRGGTGLPERAALEVPFHAQEAYQCGPAALAMVLGWGGVDVSPEALAAEVFVPSRKGSFAVGLVAAARAHGRVPVELHGLEELLSELAAGRPVLVLQDLGLDAPLLSRPHFAVVVGYDLPAHMLFLHSGTLAQRPTTLANFERTWRRSGGFAAVVLPPDALPAGAGEARWLAAAAGLERAGRGAEAETAYRAALARWPGSANAWLGLGNVALASGRVADAEPAFRRATELDAGSAPAWNNLAHVLHRLGRRGEAVTAAEHAVSLGGPHLQTARRTLEEIQADGAR